MAFARIRNAGVILAAMVAVSGSAAGAAPTGSPGQPQFQRMAMRSGPSSCPDLMFYAARGSGEARGNRGKTEREWRLWGLGPRVGRLFTEWSATLQPNVRVETLHNAYTAEGTVAIQPDPVLVQRVVRAWVTGGIPKAAAEYWYGDGERGAAKYVASVQVGTVLAVETLRSYRRKCPTTGLVLAGYSQGAMVIHQAALTLQQEDATFVKSVVGTFLIADGDRFDRTAAPELRSAVWCPSVGDPYVPEALGSSAGQDGPARIGRLGSCVDGGHLSQR